MQISERFLRLPAVLELTGLSRTAVYGREDFPRPIKISKRASAWCESEVRNWILQRIAEAKRARAEKAT